MLFINYKYSNTKHGHHLRIKPPVIGWCKEVDHLLASSHWLICTTHLNSNMNTNFPILYFIKTSAHSANNITELLAVFRMANLGQNTLLEQAKITKQTAIFMRARHRNWFNSLRPRLNRCDFADDNFKYIFVNENVLISNFHLRLFPRIQLTITQHRFGYWLGADQATNHYLSQWVLFYWRVYASLALNELNHHLIGNKSIRHQNWMSVASNVVEL